MTGPSALPVATEAGKPGDAVEVGRVIGAWGVKGGLKIKPIAADPQALFSSKRWYLEASTRLPARPDSGLPRWLRIIQAREQGDSIVATAHDIADRDAAESLKGASVFVSRASFPTPDPDEFYWVDLIGLSVVDQAQRALGRVVGLIETGPHCVLRIQGADPEADETLIPFVDVYVLKVDLAGRRIDVEWQDGD